MSEWDDDDPGAVDDDGAYDPIVEGYEDAGPARPGDDELDGPGPLGCPVVPLGTHQGRYYYVTTLGELTYLRAREHTDLALLGLMGGNDRWLWRMFPVVRPDGQGGERPVGWHAKRAATWLMNQCTRAGLVDVTAELRGLGTWRGPQGDDGRAGLIVHAGDAVLVGGQWQRPGRHGAHIYGADRRLDKPGNTPLTPAQAEQLLGLLNCWRIRGPGVVYRLLLGFLGAATMPGALDWRPAIWLVGAKETGKTTLQSLFAELLGSTAVAISNTSEAAIRHVLGIHALTVLVDEFETANLGPVVESVLDLVRVASSGRSGKVVRGGMDGRPVFSTLVASFAFSSIHTPHLSSADRSRLTVFEFGPLDQDPETVSAFEAARAAVAGFGPALRRRCLDAWPRLSRTLSVVQAALAAQGHGNRARDQLGTLLAWSHLLLSDAELQPAEAEALVAELDAAAMAEEADDLEDHQQWLLHLLASRVPDWQAGERRPIGRLIVECRDLPGGAHAAENKPREELANIGLQVVDDERRRPHGPWLLVSNSSPDIARIFQGTRWEKVRWRDLLLRSPAAHVAGQVRFHAGFGSKAVAVHMDELPMGDRFGSSVSIGR